MSIPVAGELSIAKSFIQLATSTLKRSPVLQIHYVPERLIRMPILILSIFCCLDNDMSSLTGIGPQELSKAKQMKMYPDLHPFTVQGEGRPTVARLRVILE